MLHHSYNGVFMKEMRAFTLAEGATHVALLENFRRCGFTLAEVLVTLGIIGVVAALVIPGVIEDYRKKATAMALKKSYAELNLALSRAQADYDSPKNWDYNTADEVNLWADKYIAPYVNKISSGDCRTNPQFLCLGVPDVVPLGYDTYLYAQHMLAPYLIVKNGGASKAWAFYRYPAYEEVRVNVYINVPKNRKAVMGKDVFKFVLFPSKDTTFKPFGLDGTVPFSPAQLSRDNLLKGPIRTGGCFKTSGGPDYYGPGDACGAVIMLDNWEIKDDYPWN